MIFGLFLWGSLIFLIFSKADFSFDIGD